jgi:hypothetical protein
MANYTIIRHTESSHVYGCTNWSTFQEVNQQAAEDMEFDGTIVWDIKANPGYVVPLNNFGIVGAASAPGPGNSKLLRGTPGLILPILGAHMEQISSTLIRCTFYLVPNAAFNFHGSPAIMPNSDVEIQVQISGCADVAGESVHIIFEKTCINSESIIEISDGREQYLAHNILSETTDEVIGTLESTSVDVKGEENYILSYTLNVNDPTTERFEHPPVLNSLTTDYYYTTDLIYEGKSEGDLTGVIYNIFKY